jgi:hypothetical protein
VIALLYAAATTGDICPIIKDEWYHDLGSFDGIAHRNKILPRQICLLCLFCER